mmetsp:Transcript_90610/g.290418  ORF Transcript_90610/g.290418 Transcript_90610/m.290418 type:complete len:214 (+) Transcript_90610:1161-1802(+)
MAQASNSCERARMKSSASLGDFTPPRVRCNSAAAIADGKPREEAPPTSKAGPRPSANSACRLSRKYDASKTTVPRPLSGQTDSASSTSTGHPGARSAIVVVVVVVSTRVPVLCVTALGPRRCGNEGNEGSGSSQAGISEHADSRGALGGDELAARGSAGKSCMEVPRFEQSLSTADELHVLFPQGHPCGSVGSESYRRQGDGGKTTDPGHCPV